MHKFLLFIFLCLGLFQQNFAGAADRAKSPNVLFIAVDDLKPELGCYGATHIHSPHIDRLAARGTVFMNAHCQQAVCSPSRTSLLTGLRPDTTQVWDLKTKFRDKLPNVVTIPEYFRKNGYETVGLGKVFDPRSVDGQGKMDARSWSRPYLHPWAPADSTFGYRDPAQVKRIRQGRPRARAAGITGRKNVMKYLKVRLTTDLADVPDEAYSDGTHAAKAVELIGELSRDDKPFFLAVGFKKPHLPFCAPKKYWDLYNRKEIQTSANQEMPTGAPSYHFQDSWELQNYDGFRKSSPLSEADQLRMIHGYYACVSYIDAQVGKLFAALEQAGIAQDTIIVLWGDHGWHLGDHGMWCKHTNYEQATRSPLIISAPGQFRPGGKSSAPAELLDVFPTLCDLAGLPLLTNLHGTSLEPVLENPDEEVKEVAISQYPRYPNKNATMGYAFRTKRFRYIEWVQKKFKQGAATGPVVARELYDYETDPLETHNLINEPQYKEEQTRLQALAERFRSDTTTPVEKLN